MRVTSACGTGSTHRPFIKTPDNIPLRKRLRAGGSHSAHSAWADTIACAFALSAAGSGGKARPGRVVFLVAEALALEVLALVPPPRLGDPGTLGGAVVGRLGGARQVG